VATSPVADCESLSLARFFFCNFLAGLGLSLGNECAERFNFDSLRLASGSLDHGNFDIRFFLGFSGLQAPSEASASVLSADVVCSP